MNFSDFISGLGRLPAAIFPNDPNTQGLVDPSMAQGAQNQGLINLGLGIMRAPYDPRGLGSGILGAYQGAQADYQGVMGTAMKNALIKREADYQQQERANQLKLQGLQLKASQRGEREQAAQTAQRVLAGLSNPQYAQNPQGYLSAVQNSPEFRDALQSLNVSPPTGTDPAQLEQFRQQLTSAAQVAAPAAQPIKLGEGDVLLNPSTYQPLASVAPKQTVEWKDTGAMLEPHYNVSGERVPGLATIPKTMPPGQQFDPGSVEQTANMIAKNQMPMLSGFSLKTPWGQAVIKRVAEINPDYAAQTYEASKQTLTAFSKGKQADTVRSLNVAVQHLDTLSSLSDALANGNLSLLNQAANLWKTQTGQSAPTNFNAAKKIVADEVVKAIVGSGGGVADREEAAKSINAAQSPAQLKGVIANYQQLMGGQLAGLQQQYEQGTGRKDFTRFVAPRTLQVLGHPATTGENVQVKSDADYEALPSGTHFVGPDGQPRVKP